MNRASAFRFACRAIAAWLAVALLTAAPSSFAKKVLEDGGGADPEVEERLDDAKEDLPGNKPPSGPPGMATIHGFVFYNDQRVHGLFSQRRYPDGSNGQQCSAAGKVPDCSDSAQRLAELRGDLAEQQKFFDAASGNAKIKAKEHLDELQLQVNAEQASLARCQQFCGLNWLGGYYMVVDVIERDNGFAPTDVNCKREEVLGSATVNRDGSYTATFSTADPCNHDNLGGTAIALRVRLQFHNDKYAFSINSEPNNPYALEHPGASTDKPLRVSAGDDITVSRLNFNTGTDPLEPNNFSIAANYYASIVDTITTLHRDNPIPFFRDEYDELQYIFPSPPSWSASATARSPIQVTISNYKSQPDGPNGRYAWIEGDLPAHEYGHVMMQRAWGGSYGFDAIGVTAGSDEKVSPQLAFKEGWAEFVKHVVFKDSLGCQRPDYDANGIGPCSDITQRLSGLRAQRERKQAELDSGSLLGNDAKLALQALTDLDRQIVAEEAERAECRTEGGYTVLGSAGEAEEGANLKGALGEGASWRDNVTKALCDWYDSAVDNDRDAAGDGDRFAAEDIHSMWSNLRNMYLDAGKYGGQYKNPGLWFCDYVRYYLDVRKSAAAVGATEHANYEDSIRDLIYNNNIGCSMASPN
jgi:hypothetical protein